ncbi:MAG: PEGA domain-containing protein [Patescibacteria group bacterium]
MAKNKRKILFYLLLIAFFILGGSAVAYVNGWRVDARNLKIAKVGAIFVRSYPDETKIYLDGKEIENGSGIFGNGTLINNLFPRTYTLKLELDGYHPWEESISVKEARVSDAKNAVLIPEKKTILTTSTLKNFWILGDKYLEEKDSGELLIDGRRVGSGEVVGLTKNNQYILTRDTKTRNYVLNNVESGTKTDIDTILKRGLGVKGEFKIKIDPEDQRKLIVLKGDSISILTVDKPQLAQIYKTDSGEMIGEDVAASQFILAWTTFIGKENKTTVFLYDKFLKRKMGGGVFFAGKNTGIEWLDSNKLAVLQDDGGLYVYDTENNLADKIASDVKNFSFSGDFSAVTAIENSALEVIFFDESNYYKFNLPDVKEVKDAVWYRDNGHLFVIYPGRVAFLDLNDGSLRNFIYVAEAKASHYSEEENALYFTEGNGLKKISFPK